MCRKDKEKFFSFRLASINIFCKFATANEGTLAQLVEHRTENPGVPSSILGGTTTAGRISSGFFYYQIHLFAYEKIGPGTGI